LLDTTSYEFYVLAMDSDGTTILHASQLYTLEVVKADLIPHDTPVDFDFCLKTDESSPLR
jgi:hypothetical protein